MLLSPSTIHFMQGEKVGLSKGMDTAIVELSHKIIESGNCPPKIQVVEKDGHWFALNNSQLHVYRCLERQGRCKHVKADVVALTDVPVDVRLMMVPPSEEQPEPPAVVPHEDKPPAEGEGSETERGYHKLQQAEPSEKPAESDDNNEDEEDDDSSDSEYSDNWSEDGDSSDCDSSHDDAEASTDDERECLL